MKPTNSTGDSPVSVERRIEGWRFPLLFGAGFCAVQTAVGLVRFGFGWQAVTRDVIPLLNGLFLFFVTGVLAGMLSQRLLRRSKGAFRAFLMAAIAVATPFAMWGSLMGGLLGPAGVLIFGIAPYLALVGGPVLLHSAWRRFAVSA